MGKILSSALRGNQGSLEASFYEKAIVPVMKVLAVVSIISVAMLVFLGR